MLLMKSWIIIIKNSSTIYKIIIIINNIKPKIIQISKKSIKNINS